MVFSDMTTMPYLNDVGVHKARKSLVLADDASVLVVSAVTVAPATRVALFYARLTATADHVVQPNLSWIKHHTVTSLGQNTTGGK